MADKIAIFGGSFNPIHTGHIKVAQAAMEECSLSKVIFLPNANPPHKDSDYMISSVHRYNMVSLAISDYPEFEISDYEMNRKNPSYTIDTMRALKNQYKCELFFIIGADSLYTLDTWKSYNELIHECKFIVADRNCSEGSELNQYAQTINSLGGNVTLISMPKVDITSTWIRESIFSGRDVSPYLPSKVMEYVDTNNLYKGNPEV